MTPFAADVRNLINMNNLIMYSDDGEANTELFSIRLSVCLVAAVVVVFIICWHRCCWASFSVFFRPEKFRYILRWNRAKLAKSKWKIHFWNSIGCCSIFLSITFVEVQKLLVPLLTQWRNNFEFGNWGWAFVENGFNWNIDRSAMKSLYLSTT